MSSPPVPKTAPRRWRKRWALIPGALLLAATLALLILYIRGTWADTAARTPASVAEGPVSQLYQTADGHKTVRCAIVLPHSVAAVWEVLTDYDRYAQMLPYLANLSTERLGDDDFRMKGLAKSALKDYWPFEIVIHQHKTADGGLIDWRETDVGGEVLLNNGSWLLSKHGDNETLLVLSLETEVQSTPTFLLRNFFRHRLKQVVRAVDQAVRERTK